MAHGGYLPPVATTSRASNSRAVPLSMASAASAAQAAGEGAFSAVQSAAAALATTMSRAGPGSPARIANHRGARFGTGNLDVRQADGVQAKIGWRPAELADSAACPAPLLRRSPSPSLPFFFSNLTRIVTSTFRHLRRAGERDLVQAVAAVDDDAPLGAQHEQGFGEQHPQLGPADAQQLPRRAGRVDERAEEVEDRRHAELRADRGDVPHGFVQQRGEAEADAQLVEAALDNRHAGLDVHAQRRQHVGRTAAAGGGAVAVLGDGHAGRGGDQGRGRADVERAEASPPVPQVSSKSRRDERMGVIFRRRAIAAPATSLTLGPLRFRAKSQRPISSSPHRPAMIASKAVTTSSNERSCPDSVRRIAASIIPTIIGKRRPNRHQPHFRANSALTFLCATATIPNGGRLGRSRQ